MLSKSMSPDELTQQLAGRSVARVSASASGGLLIHFADGATLAVDPGLDGFLVAVAKPVVPADPLQKAQPTPRQREYLLFITKYILRFGRPPAEADIQRHFLVSAPSVNSMVQALERRGFITRQPGVPRSICVCFDVSEQAGPKASSAERHIRGKT